MRKILFLVASATIFLASCQKEILCEQRTMSCHGDTTKTIVITGPRTADTIRQGQSVETTWIGHFTGEKKISVTLKWIDYNTNTSYYQVLGWVTANECSFAWKAYSQIHGNIDNENCFLVFAGTTTSGYVESGRFTIKP